MSSTEQPGRGSVTGGDQAQHVHGPDCDHGHEHDQSGHVHGPHCNHDHHDMAPIRQVVRDGPKVGRNDPCPCGSGKKHKKCCLA